MKGKNLIIVLVLAATAAGAGPLMAQEFVSEYPSSTVDENGRPIKSGYITNKWYDNWVISVDGGVSTVQANVSDFKFSPALDFSVTKWAMPAMAFRFGIQAGQGREGLESYAPQFQNHSPLPYGDGVLSYDYFYAHADMLWCATNSFLGYKFRRFWNISPYISGGYQRIFDPSAYDTNFDNEAVFGGGVLNVFRISDRVNLNLDLRATNFSGRYHSDNGQRSTMLTALAGLSFNIYKSGWRRAHELEKVKEKAESASAAALSSLAAAEGLNRDLAAENTALRNRAQELEDEINALKAVAAASPYREIDELLRRIGEAGLVIYYDLGKDIIRDCEQLHINQYVQAVLDAEPDHVFYLTGSADRGTGTEATNRRLSNDRVQNVKRYLVNELKVNPAQVIIKKAIISDQHADGRLDRCVLFENE